MIIIIKLFTAFIIIFLLISNSNLINASNNYSIVQEDLYSPKDFQEEQQVNKDDLLKEQNNSDNGTSEMPNTLEKNNVIKTYNTLMPENLIKNIKYTNYTVPNNYVIITNAYANIREKATTQSSIIKTVYRYKRLPLISKVTGESGKNDTNNWYKVLLKNETDQKIGYIFSSLVEERQVNISKMFDAVSALKNEVEQTTTGYISNFRNINGIPPLYQGTMEDNYGINRYQSAPAYTEPDPSSKFRYIQDGTIVSILDETEKYYMISSLNFKWKYYIEKKYISFNNSIENLTKAIVIDRKNQNEGVFEYIDNQWNLISTSYATTGASSFYKLPTDLGYYMTIAKEKRFLYLGDITKEIQGYAPFTIRFNGGAYIHGVPVNYKKVNEKLIDPGMIEYSSSIGTIPLSHKCVRNYTSHAKFLYDWVEISKSAIIVIE